MISSDSFDKFFAIILVVCFFLLPPSMLGLKTTILALPILVFVLLFFLVTNLNSIDYKVIPNLNFKVMMCLLIYFLYLYIQSISLVGAINIELLKAFLSIFIVLIVYSILFTSNIIKFLFLKYLIGLFILFTLSNIISILLTFTLGVDSISLLKIPMYGDTYELHILFPFTPVYGRLGIADVAVMRLSSLFREPGITQAFYLWAFIICDKYFTNPKLKYILILGVVMTMSTVGFLCLFLVMTLFLFTKKFNVKRLLSGLLFCSFSIFIYTTIPGISLASKNAGSYDARVNMAEVSLDVLKENPLLGVGYANNYIDGTSTNFIQEIYTIGIVGFLLYIIIFMMPLLDRRTYKLSYSISISALFITLMSSQPMALTPLVFLLIIAQPTKSF